TSAVVIGVRDAGDARNSDSASAPCRPASARKLPCPGLPAAIIRMSARYPLGYGRATADAHHEEFPACAEQ
ncbi:MAG: hypothetical protein ACJ715_03990, partial [Ornithinibacter sp.]